MHVEANGRRVRGRAHPARETSLALRAESRALAAIAVALRGEPRSRRESLRMMVSQRSEWDTAAIDGGLVTWRAMAPFVELHCRVLGRDPAIEQAKTVVCERYGMSRRDAFVVLQRVSTHTSRKLRDVARGLVDASGGLRASRRRVAHGGRGDVYPRIGKG
jgi:ANTAR domain